MRYEAQLIQPLNNLANWRITDTFTDSRVATCYVREDAELMIAALNFFENHSKVRSRSPRKPDLRKLNQRKKQNV